jgi:hypothetical protein
MLAEFKQLGVVFVTENNNGVITVYSVGNMPLKQYTMQATIVEIECEGEDIPVVGVPTGTPVAQSDWNQTDETKADYIKNKPGLATCEFGEYQDKISLIGITETEPKNMANIFEDYILPTDYHQKYFINYQGKVKITFTAQGVKPLGISYAMCVDGTSIASKDCFITSDDGLGMIGYQYSYEGYVYEGIEFTPDQPNVKFTLDIFSGQPFISYNDGLMSGTDKDKIYTLESQVSNKADKESVYTKVESEELISQVDRYTYYTPSVGLEIEDGVVIGIGSCRDEHIVIPELYNDGGVKKPVYRIARDVFGSLLGDKGVQIKSITFPYSIKELSPHTIDSWRCPNLKSVYLMNPDVSWDKDESFPFHFEANVKDIYFGFSEAQYDEMIARNGGALITLKNENIAVGIVPTKHFGHFVTSAVIGDINGKIGDIDTALDAILAIQSEVVGDEA